MGNNTIIFHTVFTFYYYDYLRLYNVTLITYIYIYTNTVYVSDFSNILECARTRVHRRTYYLLSNVNK